VVKVVPHLLDINIITSSVNQGEQPKLYQNSYEILRRTNRNPPRNPIVAVTNMDFSKGWNKVTISNCSLHTEIASL